MASLFKRGKTWWVSYYALGKHVRRSLKTTNKKAADREKMAIEAKLLDPYMEAPRRTNPKVADFWKVYLRWAKEHKRPSAIERSTTFWNQLVGFTGANRIDEITRSGVERFKIWRKQEGNAEQTINNGLREIKAIFNRGRKLGIITGRNPVDGVDLYPMPHRSPDFHTKEQLELLLKKAADRGQELKWTVLLCGWAGLRKGEVANCRWEWFDFNREKPRIQVRSFEGFQIKDHDERSIPMNRRIYDELYPHHQQEGYVFPHMRNAKHQRYRIDLRASLTAALRDADLPTEHPYQRLRHSFGSLLAQQGVSLFKISKWMGHSTVVVTEKHYAGLQVYDAEIDLF